jgi:hypothetical protein
MLAVLPLAALAALTLLLGNLAPAWGWRRAALRATLAVGAFLVLVTEGLSLVSAITPWALAAAWAALLLLVALGIIRQWRRAGRLLLPTPRIPGNWLDRALLASLVAVMAVTAVVAWYAPPNTWDSLNYHMPRVAHWAQDHSLRPFATGIEIQNGMSPGAEMAVLNLYVLAGGDRLANFVEWLAMALSVIGAALVARQLGGKGPAGLIAGVVVATLPMGIIQASSTMTDYVTALWVLCAASETLSLGLANEPARAVVPWLATATGLALLTKATAFPFLLPLGLWAAYLLFRRVAFGRALGLAGVIVLIVLLLNAGHLARSVVIYGSPVAGERVATHSNELRDPRALISNALKNAALHAGTPWPGVNRVIERAVLKVHQWMRLDVNDPRTTTIGEFSVPAPTRAEDRAGNPAQAWLYVIATVLALVRWKRVGGRTVIYLLAAVAGFLVFGYLFKWQVFGVRLHLPFFVLFAPVAAVVLSTATPPFVGRTAALALFFVSIPWLVGIEERPLLRNLEGSLMPSVLYEPRGNLYIRGGALQAFTQIADRTAAAGCRQVGIMLAGGGAEYPVWVFLGAPDESLRIEWIVSGTPSARFEDPSFVPCAVVCDDSCPSEWTVVRGLPLDLQIEGYRLFMNPSAVGGDGS